MEGFDKQVAKRLPLAEAVMRLFAFVCEPDFLEEVFQRHRGRAYEKIISFSLFVQLINDALLEHGGSGYKSFQRAEQTGELEATIRAAYRKLERIPLSLSMGLLGEATARMRELYPQAMIGSAVPESLLEFEIVIHDGKKLKHVAKRLKVLQNVKGHVLGGKLVVALSLNTGLAVAMGACEDGEAGDQPLVPITLRQVRQLLAGKRLHVADRQFCDLKQTRLFAEDGDHFLVRWNKKVGFHRDRNRRVRQGKDRYGRKFTQDWGWIGSPNSPDRRYVRRIHLKRTDGEDVIVLTDLLDADAYPADDLLEVYLQRWGIERMFQQVTEVFHLKSLIGTTPQATVFQASFCFLLYNMIQVIRAYIAEGQWEVTVDSLAEISSENLFYDVHRQVVAWSEMLTTRQTLALLSITWTGSQVARRLRELLHGQWSECWRKAPSNTHVTPPKKGKDYLTGGHSSVFRLMQRARAGP
jgi:IS4 transposase